MNSLSHPGSAARWAVSLIALLMLVVLPLLNVAAQTGTVAAASAAPTITSDKADYAPGSTVNLSGANWQAGESVQLYVNDSVGSTWSWSDTVTVDSSGNLADTLTLPNSFVANYSITATGSLGDSATGSFTDSNLSIGLATSSDQASPAPANFIVNYIPDLTSTSCGGTTAQQTASSNPVGIGVGTGHSVALVSATASGYTFAYFSSTATSTTPLSGSSLCIIGGGSVTNVYAHFKALAAPTITSPAASSTTNSSSVTVSGTAPANSGVALYDSSTAVSGATTTADGSGNWSVALTGVADGQHTYTAEDTVSGVTSAASNAVVVTVDTQAPTVTITSGGPSGTISTNSATFQWSATDPSPSSGCCTYAYKLVPGGGTDPGYGSFGNATSNTFSSLADGSYTFSVEAEDTAGNVSSADSQTFTVSTSSAPVISDQPSGATVNVGGKFSLSVTASGNPSPTYQWYFSSTQTGTFSQIPGATSATYSVSSASMTDAGYYYVVVTNIVDPVTSNTVQVTVNKLAQSITFNTVPDKTYGNDAFDISSYASATSGLPVTFSIDSSSSGVCSAGGTNGATITILAAGTCKVLADQAGNDTTYSAASQVSQSFSISKADLTITADNQSMTYGGTVPSFTWTPTGLVNGDTKAAITGTSCTSTDGSGTTVSATTPANTYDITCSGATDTNYAIKYKPGTLTVNPAATTVSVSQPTGLTFGQTSVTLNASVTANSPSTATVNEGTVTFQLTQNGSNAGSAVTVNVTNGSTGNPTYSLPNGAVGSYTVTATYNPAATAPNFLGSSDSTQSVSVTYAFSGFLQPINDPGHLAVCGSPCPMSVFKAGSTIPVKFQLTNASGQIVQAATAPTFSATKLTSCTVGSVDDTASATTSSTGNTFQFDSTGQQYIYNWSTKGLSGCWTVSATLNDGTSQSVTIGLR